ncbi:PBP1A family penicillin-binding protein [Ruoffia sp. FAM 24228]|uniref:PBP1A family penicillin-binding protein n=1 Tax=Ruoffia sp. FAM 24228 TaxID=3259517 RepID=UPI003887F2D6
MATGSRVERKKYRNKKNNKGNKNKRNRKPKKIVKRIFILLIMLFFIAVIGGAGVFGYYAMNSPEISFSDLQGQVSSKIYDKSGDLVKELGGLNKDVMEASEIPQVLEDAVIAIEDTRFYNHNGVDPIRIVGSLIANLRAGGIVQGGSTITQQLVKLSVFSTDFQDQTLERKSQEAWLAMQIEQEYNKEEILTLYLNKLFYSNNVYGAKTAAKEFFGKDIQEINLAEAALLAGLPQAPSNYDPYTNPAEAKERRDLVLAVMLDREMISQQQYDEAVNTAIESMLVPLSNSSTNKVDLVIDAYLDVVAQEAQDKMNINIYTDGVEVYTNMDYQAQEKLYDTVNNNEAVVFPDDQMQTAASIVDVDNGQLVALIGGRKQEVAMGLNRANTLNRSIGSTMKPLSAYGPALEYLNFSTGTLVVDEPYTYSSGQEFYNYDFEYEGNMTLREALAGSRNIPALKVLQAVGLDNAYAFLQKMDINILNDNKRELVEANALGGGITPIQLSAAYAAIANYGEYNKPYTVNRVITSAGTEEIFETETRQAMKDTTAYMLTDILKGVPGVFASSSDIEGIYHAGKTGTTNYTEDQLAALGLDQGTYAAPDGWYVGMSPQYSISSWVGYDNPNEPGNYLTLEETAIPQHIYREMMTYLMTDVPVTDWEKPESIVEVEIEKYTDPILLPGPYTPAEAKSNELFIRGQEPTEQSLAYGRYINPPTGFYAEYDQENKVINAQWGPLTESGQFELSVNGQVVYTGTNTAFQIPAESDGEYVLRLRIVDGNSSSDVMVITLTLTTQEDSSGDESESEDETTSSDDESEESTPEGTETESGPNGNELPEENSSVFSTESESENNPL